MRLDRLDYQFNAIEKAMEAINEKNIVVDDDFYANPIIEKTPYIDVKMETGTGKTYVYTRLIHSLRQKYGIFKFIILVPSVAIKEGVKMSIASDDWNKHFRQEFGNQSIHLGVINAGDFDAKKGKRKQIPEALRSFCDSSRVEDKSIHVLLLNDGMLSSVSMSKTDYDTTLFGNISCPLKGLKAVRPIVIIDEPHRFSKTNKSWKNITEELCPQIIIRFGATFPEIKIEGQIKRDYENLVYDLNSVQAFNEGLVKGVHIEYPVLPDTQKELLKYKVKQIVRGKSVTFVRVGSSKECMLDIGEDLANVDGQFLGGITLERIDSAASAFLSNDLELHTGMELIPQVFSSGYQELMLNQALEAHFKKEKENFYRKDGNLPRIKTNSLFFIDSIASFRGSNNEKGWLRLKFEELLTKRINKEIDLASGEYKDFLQASLVRNEKGEMAVIAGYFAEDNLKKGDVAIQDEVDKVLRDKEQSLKFKNKNGEWNVCRFFFSKWTLCEGWDNPNVFVIAKLRSSGSEIRKLQEVGRGLRLPFDETGSRITPELYGEDFRLTYIIDYSEKEFARKLVGEINADGGKLDEGKITDAILAILVKTGYAINVDKVIGKLLLDDIIDREKNIIDIDKLFSLLPEESGFKVKEGVITGNGMPDRPKVRLNRDNFHKIQDLWDKVTKRYLLKFDEIGKTQLEKLLLDIFSNDKIFVRPSTEIKDEYLKSDGKNISIKTGGYKAVESELGIINYGEFLKCLNKRTSLPITMLHKAVVSARQGKETPPALFNADSLEKVIKEFEKIFVEKYNQKFSYQSLDYTAQTSLFENGDFVCELNQTYLGVKIAKDVTVDENRYLYDKVVYDSDIEYEVLKIEPPDRIIVYGKLPRKSIKLPTYTGGTTSPDFVYTIRDQEKGDMHIHFVVETKSDNPRLSDEIAVSAQKKAFEYIGSNIKWDLVTDVADFQRGLENLIGKSGK